MNDHKTILPALSQPGTKAFACVYCGLGSSCVVSHSQLASVHIDTTSKPVMFRIAAENDKGWVVIPFNVHLYFVT